MYEPIMKFERIPFGQQPARRWVWKDVIFRAFVRRTRGFSHVNDLVTSGQPRRGG